MSVHQIKTTPIELAWMARALLAAAHKSPDADARHHAQITITGETLEGIATDGHRLHLTTVDLLGGVDDDVTFTIPRAALDWIGKNVVAFKPKKDALVDPVATVIVDVDHDAPGGAIAILFQEWDDEGAPSTRFDAGLIPDPFPPMHRVLNDARGAREGAPSAIALAYLADAVRLHTSFTAEPVIRYTVTDDKRLGPALLDFWEQATLRATALIMPRLSLPEDAA